MVTLLQCIIHIFTSIQYDPSSRTETKLILQPPFCLLQFFSFFLSPPSFFMEKNSFYGLLSSQLRCSRCRAADAVCCLLARNKTHRDQLICTVINRKETFERSAKARSQPGHVSVKRSHLTRAFIWLMDYILRVWTPPLIKSPQKETPEKTILSL